MSYPPGGPGYPPASQPTNQFTAPTQQFGKVPEPASGAPDAGSQLPLYLTAAVAALGVAVYLSSFGPLFTANADFFTPTLLDMGIVAALLGALVAGVALLPKQTARPALVAVLSVLAFLLVIAIVLTAPNGVSIDWGLYLIIAFTVLQAIVAVAVLLFDAGVLTPPVPRPKYETAVRPVRRAVLRPAPSRRSTPAAGAPAASRRLSVSVRYLPRRRPLDRRICGRTAKRPADPANGFPHLRTAAVGLSDDRRGACAARIAVAFHAVRPAAVVI